MNYSAHKTALQNSPKPLRIYPFVSTGKEKDEETGYGYFGARYMDHELMTMWLSVDPMADKSLGIPPLRLLRLESDEAGGSRWERFFFFFLKKILPVSKSVVLL